jgi:hypothetical protein
MRDQTGLITVVVAAAVLCTGCAAAITGGSIVASMATSVGTHIAMDNLFGESKVRREARAAYERAPPCARMTHGVQNGRVVTVVNDIAWSDIDDAGKRRLLIDYQVSNLSDGGVIVTPRQLAVTDAAGKLTKAQEGAGANPSRMAIPDEAATLAAGASWSLVSVFEVPPGEYALMVPNGRTEPDPVPTWSDGCRFSGPSATALR